MYYKDIIFGATMTKCYLGKVTSKKPFACCNSSSLYLWMWITRIMGSQLLNTLVCLVAMLLK